MTHWAWGIGIAISIGLLSSTSALAEKRVALVVGNSNYEQATPLPNPKNDAKLIRTSLERLGFDVVSGVDLGFRAFGKTLKKFKSKLVGADVALFFYAGHGLQVKGRNFLIPVDAQLEDELDLSYQAVDLTGVLKQMERLAGTKLVFLDACRDNPLARSLHRSMGLSRSSASAARGLARVKTASGTLIAFATEPGDVALDGDGTNSPFTTALVKHIETPNLDVARMMRRVRKEVIKVTANRQTPWTSSSMTDDFYFNRKVVVEPEGTARLIPDDSALELATWDAVKNSESIELYEMFLSSHPNGHFAVIAKAKIRQLKNKKRAIAVEQSKAKAASEARLAEKALLEKELARLRLAEQRSREELAAAKAKSAKNEIKVASLPTATRPDVPPVVEELSKGDLAKGLQKALRAAGCYAMAIDGDWGNGSKRAMTAFNRYAKLSLSAEAPESKSVIDSVHAHLRERGGDRVCPLTCGRGTVKKGDSCVAVHRPPSTRKKPPSTRKKSSSKRRTAKRPTSRKKAPTQRRSAPPPSRGPISIGVGAGGISF